MIQKHFLPHFAYDFSRKTFLMLYSINWPNFIAWLSLFLETLGNMCIAIVCYPGCDVMDFEINLIFLIKPFFLQDPKVMAKTEISWERKELLRSNKKHLSSFLKGFQLSKTVSNLRVHLWWKTLFFVQCVFYLSTISWLRLQQEPVWVNVNFERRDLHSKSCSLKYKRKNN